MLPMRGVHKATFVECGAGYHVAQACLPINRLRHGLGRAEKEG